MDPERQALQQVKLRAFDLSERTLHRGAASAVRRLDRLRNRAFMIAQCAVTAGLSWWLATSLLGHQAPFFAAVAAIITLGFSFGARLRRAVEVAIGVAIGVAVGDLWIHLFGTGVWQIIAVCAIAMALATLLGAGQLMIIQAGVQSIIITALAPTLGTGVGVGVGRWVDAAVGCSLALLVTTLAPISPLRKPGLVAAQVLREMADVLTDTATALRTEDGEAAEAVLDRVRAGEGALSSFDQAATEGVAVVRSSPFLWRQRSRLTALADLYPPLDHARRNLRVLVRRSTVAVWRGQHVPEEYVALVDRLATVCRFMAGQLEAQRFPTLAQSDLRAIGDDSAHLTLTDSLSAVVILAQVRSMTADLMELTGIDYEHARDLIPDMD